MVMSERLDEIVGPLNQKAIEKEADRALDYARVKLKKAIKRLFEYEVVRVQKLIEEPSRFSGREWERVITDIEWTAKRFADLAERMKEARPLTRITDDEPREVMLRPGGGKAKLTAGDVNRIKVLINEGKFSLEQIAELFDISPQQVSMIKNERSWPEIEPRINGRLDRYGANGKLKRRL
jgi:hypothetical protein